MLEALGISIVGSLVGYALGTYSDPLRLRRDQRSQHGLDAFPTRSVGDRLGTRPLLVVVTVLAALYPAKLALSVSPAEALEFE